MGKNPVVIGIAGGSGSGKTSVTRSIYEQFKGHSILMIQQDLYYKDQSHLPFEERLNTNYDHPLAFDNDYLIEHIQDLLNYRPIEKPIYDYKLHTRSEETVHVEPKDVIILEGILVLEDKRLRDLMDIKLASLEHRNDRHQLLYMQLLGTQGCGAFCACQRIKHGQHC